MAGQVTNRYGIANNAVAEYPEVFVCRHLRQPWTEFWKRFKYYG